METFANEHVTGKALWFCFPASAHNPSILFQILALALALIQTHSVPTAALGFLTETGRTRASIILSTGTESSFQVTQIRIKVCSCWELLK